MLFHKDKSCGEKMETLPTFEPGASHVKIKSDSTILVCWWGYN